MLNAKSLSSLFTLIASVAMAMAIIALQPQPRAQPPRSEYRGAQHEATPTSGLTRSVTVTVTTARGATRPTNAAPNPADGSKS